MDSFPATVHTTVNALREGHRRGFSFSYAGKDCVCFDASGHEAFGRLRAGDRVTIMGNWSSAVRGIFEGEALDILRG